MARRRGFRSAAKGLLLRLDLYGLWWRLRRVVFGLDPRTVARNRRWRRGHPGEPPVPPARLIFDIIGVCDIATYIDSGRLTADKIETALREAGRPLAGFQSVLDFGCGCGRILRHMPARGAATWHGSDYNAELVDWCRANLGFARFMTNGLEPPLNVNDDSFDLVYANSVFTHLDERLQTSWLGELKRVLRSNGVLLLTTHGDAWFAGLGDEESAAYSRGELVVRSAASSGSNLCEAYHPPEYFRRAAGTLFRRLHHFPKGDPERKEQDVWVLEV